MICLLNPRLRRNEPALAGCCIALFFSVWIEKGMSMIVAGLTPSTLGQFIGYRPTMPEVLIAAGIYSAGAILVTIFFKIFIKIKDQTEI
jgi:molybdopterin-containing oxidoreductase family membrane subunit